MRERGSRVEPTRRRRCPRPRASARAADAEASSRAAGRRGRRRRAGTPRSRIRRGSCRRGGSGSPEALGGGGGAATARPRRSAARVAPERRPGRGTGSGRACDALHGRAPSRLTARTGARDGAGSVGRLRGSPPSTSRDAARGREQPAGADRSRRPGARAGLWRLRRERAGGAERPPGVPPGRWAARGSCAAPGPRSFSTRASSSGMEAAGASWIALSSAISSASRGCAARDDVPDAAVHDVEEARQLRGVRLAGQRRRPPSAPTRRARRAPRRQRLGDEEVAQLQRELLGEPLEVDAAR